MTSVRQANPRLPTIRRPATTTSWSRRLATTNRQQAVIQSDGSINSTPAGSSVIVLGGVAGAVIGAIGTMLACQVWIRRRDARAKETVHYTGQLAVV